MRRAFALVLALLFVLLGIYLARRPAASLTATGAPAKREPQPPRPETPPGALAAPTATPANNASAATASNPRNPTAAQTSATASGRTMSLDEIQRVVVANQVPGRMIFVDFVLDRTGLRPVAAVGAAGRAKPGASRSGFGFVHYEVFGAAGDLLLNGSVEDPTRRRVEHPANSDDGRITSTVQFSDEGMLAVRLPGEVPAVRIVFFRDKNPLAPGAASRENLGEFQLRPQL